MRCPRILAGMSRDVSDSGAYCAVWASQARVCDVTGCGMRRICDVSPNEPPGGCDVSSCAAVCGIIELVAAM